MRPSPEQPLVLQVSLSVPLGARTNSGLVRERADLLQALMQLLTVWGYADGEIGARIEMLTVLDVRPEAPREVVSILAGQRAARPSLERSGEGDGEEEAGNATCRLEGGVRE